MRPGGNTLPDGGMQTTVGGAAPSSLTAGGGKFTTTPFVAHVQTIRLVGQRITGGWVSRWTVTVNVQVLRLVQSSVAVQTTTVVPDGKRLPDGGTQETATFVSALSVAVGTG